MDNRRPSKKRSVEADRSAEHVHPIERPTRRTLSYQQIYQSGIDHRLMPQHIQELLQRAADQGNRFVGGSVARQRRDIHRFGNFSWRASAGC